MAAQSGRSDTVTLTTSYLIVGGDVDSETIGGRMDLNESAQVGWTSMGVAKLVVDALMPLVLLVLGILINKRTKRLEQAIWASQKRTEWTQNLFNKTSAPLNQLYCCYNYVGNYTEISAPEIINIKRKLDREILGNKLLLGDTVLEKYDSLMKGCFEMSGGRGVHIKIKANKEMYKETETWVVDYDTLFVDSIARIRRADFNELYNSFMQAFFAKIGVSEREEATASK
jgi:hypothetical protein